MRGVRMGVACAWGHRTPTLSTSVSSVSSQFVNSYTSFFYIAFFRAQRHRPRVKRPPPLPPTAARHLGLRESHAHAHAHVHVHAHM